MAINKWSLHQSFTLTLMPKNFHSEKISFIGKNTQKSGILESDTKKLRLQQISNNNASDKKFRRKTFSYSEVI